MKKIFLDTNIVLDFYLDREGFSDAAEKILTNGYGKDKKFLLYVSALTYANVAYIARKKFPGDKIYHILDTLQEFAGIAPISIETIQTAISLRASDFEDALQYFSAKSIEADIIITRNIKDFAFAKILVLTPNEFLCSFQSTEDDA